ncbi:zinc-binding dehydrogenase [Robbsia sp. KACC 23696]|uniref:zinc-binding dehydrogenase n=1 Tax=Robbsia sp. KACC 23696 TaxID=3149231 RepID=UPI00325B135E
MKALCVTPSRTLAVREIPTPDTPAPGQVLIEMVASAINHGDRTFLTLPTAAGNPLAMGRHDVWGASGAGRVLAIGAGVPDAYLGKQVAAYRSLHRTPDSVGLWCERAAMPYAACLILPDSVRAIDYCGSLVNVMTAYAFLDDIVEAGHKGIIVTAGSSATGLALAALARLRNIPTVCLVRSDSARDALLRLGVEHVLVTRDSDLEKLPALAARLEATAVFDGIGGELLGRIAPALPMNATIYCYGFLGGPSGIAIPSVLFMMKNLTIRRFSNFESRTVKAPTRLIAALHALEEVIADPIFRTKIGETFRYDQIEQAMAYEEREVKKAILVA